jgi:hypothetical protein
MTNWIFSGDSVIGHNERYNWMIIIHWWKLFEAVNKSSIVVFIFFNSVFKSLIMESNIPIIILVVCQQMKAFESCEGINIRLKFLNCNSCLKFIIFFASWDDEIFDFSVWAKEDSSTTNGWRFGPLGRPLKIDGEDAHEKRKLTFSPGVCQGPGQWILSSLILAHLSITPTTPLLSVTTSNL